jgi:hypothetical protein
MEIQPGRLVIVEGKIAKGRDASEIGSLGRFQLRTSIIKFMDISTRAECETVVPVSKSTRIRGTHGNILPL